MANIKPLDRTAAKWARVSAGASNEYREGVENPRADWATQTKAAEGNYEAGVTAAIQRKAFGKGVGRAGTEKWQKNAIALGPGRFATGVQNAQSAYADGFAPYQAVIAAITLPKRGPKGAPENIQRVAAIAKALHDKKLQLEQQG